MRYIFLDCGAHRGSSVRIFRRRFKESKKYEIHSFECNPEFIKDLKKIKNIYLHPVAIWNCNRIKKFYLGKKNDGIGSSFFKNKITGGLDKDHPIKVTCIDFDMWIKKNCRKDDYIVLKMDIEGAEFVVLDSMIKGGSIEYINELYCEFHGKKIGNEKLNSEIQNMLLKKNIIAKYWSARMDKIEGITSFSEKPEDI